MPWIRSLARDSLFSARLDSRDSRPKRRIGSAIIQPTVKGQEKAGLAGQPGGHVHQISVCGKVNQAAAKMKDLFKEEKEIPAFPFLVKHGFDVVKRISAKILKKVTGRS